jgi:GR25 family glycosyltransferase involved in LPS biosynthesis
MKVNEYFDRVVVINLDRRPDRMLKLGAQLDELGIQYERFSAIDGKAEGIAPMEAGKLSHLKVIQELNGEKVLILEDDALFVDGFQERFDAEMETLPEDWDVFYLGVLLPRFTGKLIPINKNWHKQVMSNGMQAYCVNPNKADYFAKEVEEYEGYIDVCFRILADRTNAYALQPNLVTQFPSYSDLREREVDDF